jgi:Phosphotransferase enzyme family
MRRWQTAPVQRNGGRIEELTHRGLIAARALARRLGLPDAEPVILSSRGNLLVHLAPAPVVARVATLNAWCRSEPFGWLAREVAVAGFAAARGGPVVPPSSLADAGPHWQDDLAISLWEYVPAAAGLTPSPAETGAALARLHRAAADCPAALGDLRPAREHVADGLGVLERESVLDPATLAELRSVHADVLAELAAVASEPVVLHGDAHAGNLLTVAGRNAGQGEPRLWIDLEETSRGPVEWDLAVLAGGDATQAAAALRAYAAEAGTDVPDAAALAPFRRARELEAAVWTVCMAQLYPARYASRVPAQLAAVLAR